MLDYVLMSENLDLFYKKMAQAHAIYLNNKYVEPEKSVWHNYNHNQLSSKMLPLYHDEFCNIFYDMSTIISSLPDEKLIDIIPHFINQFLKHDVDVFFIIERLFSVSEPSKLPHDTLEIILDKITSVNIKANPDWVNVMIKSNTMETLAFFIRTPSHFINKYKTLAGLNHYSCESLMILIQNNQLTNTLEDLLKNNKHIFLQILPEIASNSFYNNRPEFIERSFIDIYKKKSPKQRETIKRILTVEQNKNKDSHKPYFDRTMPLLNSIDSYHTLHTDLSISETKTNKMKI